MTASIGSVAVLTALLAAVAGITCALLGRARRASQLLRAARWYAVGACAAVTVAVVALEVGLVARDFSIRYVAQNVNLGTPLLFRIIGLWGALEGSILLWAWFLAAFTALVAVRYRHVHTETVPVAVAVLLGIQAFFLALMAGPADPFRRLLPAPVDGLGLNPLLQNHPLMAVHPPMLYLGYVGFSVPYAFAMAALLSRRLQDTWMTVTRRWTIAAWSFLTAGIVLGAWWSYEVLGWGGYWAWDPVENAALLPWLAATALLHSVIMQERRHLLALWNHALVIVTFLLTIFGTFLTRSGILASVHSFTISLIGPLFLAFIGAVLLFSAYTLSARWSDVRSTGTLPAYLSRESLFLLNNVVLLTMAATVFAGTTFPLIAEAASGVRLSVGPPYFNRLMGPLAVGLLVLMGVATVLPWGPITRDALRRVLSPLVLALLLTAVLLSAGVRQPPILAILAVVTFTASAQLVEFHRGARMRGHAHGEAYPLALARLFQATRRRYTGYLAHLGLAVAIAAITASAAYRTESEHTVRPGDTIRVPGYLLRYEGASVTRYPDRFVIAASVAVFPGSRAEASTESPGAYPAPASTDSPGAYPAPASTDSPGAYPAPASTPRAAESDPVQILRPAEHLYPQQRTPIPTPAVRSTWRGDLYLVLLSVDRDGAAVIKAITNPLVPWIWTGGLLMAAAGLLNLWPTRRG